MYGLTVSIEDYAIESLHGYRIDYILEDNRLITKLWIYVKWQNHDEKTWEPFLQILKDAPVFTQDWIYRFCPRLIPMIMALQEEHGPLDGSNDEDDLIIIE